MARIELFAHKSKRVNTILNQLSSDFQPGLIPSSNDYLLLYLSAVKNVAQAGQNLLRALQNFNRNHYLYTASLYALAFSSSTAEQNARECTKQLEKITEAMKTIYANQTEWMDHYTEMTNTITGNCEDEKQRLKSLRDEFIKREKKLNKAVNSGKKMPSELENFYESEMTIARNHQISSVKERNGLRHQRVNSHTLFQEDKRLSVLNENEADAHSDPSTIPQITGQQGLFRPIPVLPMNQQKFRHSLVETYSNHINNDLIYWERQNVSDENQPKRLQVQGKTREGSQLQKFYRDGPSRSEELNELERETYGRLNERPFSRKPHNSQVTALSDKRNDPGKSMVVGNGGNIAHNHSRTQSSESMTSSTIATTPIFSPTDYNRLLECTTPYEAQGDNRDTQLSLGLGERILLMKSGTRGWVLGRSEDGSRQGWFPAKYLKLV
uniref:SH3 domain-containing protein n=1 Tax=Meloidogyne floridensis TaxID=298350 RepID=A0A915NH88_9BILA